MTKKVAKLRSPIISMPCMRVLFVLDRDQPFDALGTCGCPIDTGSPQLFAHRQLPSITAQMCFGQCAKALFDISPTHYPSTSQVPHSTQALSRQ